MKEKCKLRQALLVEGRYDAARLANLVDGLILTTDGFDIYSNREKQLLLRRLGRERGLVILTDSDSAGFRIRTFVTNLVGEEYVFQAMVPAQKGKERRKALPGKEGLLGVEGMEDRWLLRALEMSGALAANDAAPPQEPGRAITYYDLAAWGLSGGPGSAERRRAFLQWLDLPPRMSKKVLLQTLNTLYGYEQLAQRLAEWNAAQPQPEPADPTEEGSA